MRINPPTLLWISAILAADLFLPVSRLAEPWLPWCGAALVILGIGISAAGKSRFQRVGTNVFTFEEPARSPAKWSPTGSTASAGTRCIWGW